MKKLLIYIGFTLLLLSTILFFSCETTDVAAFTNAFANSFANSYSSLSDEAVTFYFYNYSSETVWLTALNDYAIKPGEVAYGNFGKAFTIYDVRYKPTYLKVSQSGLNFYFTN